MYRTVRCDPLDIILLLLLNIMCHVVRVASECNLRVSYKSLVATCGAASKRGGVGFSNIWSASFLELLRKIKVVQMLVVFNFNFFMKVIERGRRKGEKLQSCKTVTFPITFT